MMKYLIIALTICSLLLPTTASAQNNTELEASGMEDNSTISETNTAAENDVNIDDNTVLENKTTGSYTVEDNTIPENTTISESNSIEGNSTMSDKNAITDDVTLAINNDKDNNILEVRTMSNIPTQEQLSLQSKYFSDGNDLFDKGMYKDAISNYDKALAILPNDTDTLYQKGRSLNNIGNFEEAISYFNKVLELDPEDTDAMTSEGIALENLGRHDDALSFYDKVLTTYPNDTSALYRKGLTLENLTKNDEAISYFNKVLTIDPTNTDAMYHMGLSLETLGNNTAAISYYDKALTNDPNNTVFLNSKNIAQSKLLFDKNPVSQIDRIFIIVIGLVVSILVAIFCIVTIKKRKEHTRLNLVISTKAEEISELSSTGDIQDIGKSAILPEKTDSQAQKQHSVAVDSSNLHQAGGEQMAEDTEQKDHLMLEMIKALQRNDFILTRLLEIIQKSLDEGKPLNKLELESITKNRITMKDMVIENKDQEEDITYDASNAPPILEMINVLQNENKSTKLLEIIKQKLHENRPINKLEIEYVTKKYYRYLNSKNPE